MLKVPVLCFLLTLLVAVPSSSQEPTPDPHSLAYCINHGGFPDKPMEEPHICHCDKPCHEGQPEDRLCKVWCRPDRCFCIAECEREPPPIPK